MKNIINKNKGITLIALVITIIVLLILAGITIASLTGENGLMGRATLARSKMEQFTIQENLQLIVEDSITEDSEYNAVKAEDFLKRNGATARIKPDNTITGAYNHYKYVVDENGKVIVLGKVESIEVTVGKNGMSLKDATEEQIRRKN